MYKYFYNLLKFVIIVSFENLLIIRDQNLSSKLSHSLLIKVLRFNTNFNIAFLVYVLDKSLASSRDYISYYTVLHFQNKNVHEKIYLNYEIRLIKARYYI